MNAITRDDVVSRLQEHDLSFGELVLQNDVRLVISEHGGRLFGPFLPDDAEAGSFFWINPVFGNAQTFKEFADTGEWNLGGERIWVGPEIQYNIRDRTDFWGSIAVPEAMDPGIWSLSRLGPEAWMLEQELTLEAFNPPRGEKQLRLERHLRPAADPLRYVPGADTLMDGVTYAGYEHLVTIAEGETDPVMSESWSLIQLNAGGLVLIPASPFVAFTDYFEPVDGTFQTIDECHVRLRITGDRRYKVGYKAAHTFGRVGYYHKRSPEQAYLLIRAFFNDPAAPYIEEPADAEGRRGHSIHVYNDGGMLGGFGELECNGRTIGGATGRSSSTDTFTLWFYAGPVPQIQRIARHLLGVQLTESQRQER